MRLLKLLLHASFFLLFTVITQVGGLVYVVAILLFKRNRLRRWLAFMVLYTVTSFALLPWLAPYGGREPLDEKNGVVVHMWLTKLLNRQYVSPQMNAVLQDVAAQVEGEIHCLDANFPFFDGFPLFPHLSHSDGKKLDISYRYQDNGVASNEQPSLSGYGVFIEPKPKEHNQIRTCLDKGYWQYDFPKYLTLGTTNKWLEWDEKRSKTLISSFAAHPSIGKIFIEPHIKIRLGLKHNKIRFHGCQAVRHDDHIHIQLR